MGDKDMPIDSNTVELIEWLEDVYAPMDLHSSAPSSVDAALRRAGARELISRMRTQLQHLQDQA